MLETSSVGIMEHANKISKDGDEMTGGREWLGVEAGRWARGNSFFWFATSVRVKVFIIKILK